MASCRLSLAAAGHESRGASIPDVLGRELREFIARAGNIFRSAGATNATAAVAEAKNLRAVASRRRRPGARKSAAGVRCVSAAACRKRRVICAKRCYRASRAASLTHVPSRCVVKCKKCVPTC
ncbi:hypothetical protein HU200_032612 [Digitaria exilis]|uniref:Uncharacterized protein n=1 Tax=Digitaria exilis TaxID=1010633 RepID=A0A835EQB6_9POAL|nr:hypothetical protein HU200_032612 [Digitaria exilis]